MKELHIIIEFWKPKVESHGKEQVYNIVNTWFSYYLTTGVNLAR